MRFRSIAASLVCLSAAIDFGPPLVIPSFIPGCEQFPPRVTAHYLVPGEPVAGEPFAEVGVYLRGQEPERRYVVIGDVEVVARSRNTSLWNMIDYASNEARKMGGEAIVDVWPRASQGVGGSADARTRHLLTAKVVR